MGSRTAPCLLFVIVLLVMAIAPAHAAPVGMSVTGGEAPHPELAASATGGPSNRIYPVHFDPHTVQLSILVMFSVLMAGFFVFAGYTIAISMPRRRDAVPPATSRETKDRRIA